MINASIARRQFRPGPALLLSALVLGLQGCPEPKVPEALPPAPQIKRFTVDPGKIEGAQPVVLTWDVEDATSVSILHAEYGEVAGVDQRLSGSIEVQVGADALFVLTAVNARGVMDSAVASVRVASGPLEVLFVASPRRVTAAEPVVLAWAAPGARTVSLTPDGGAALDLGGQLQSGTVVVRPERTTTWTLRVDGVSFTSRVEVLPTVVSFKADPPVVAPGGEVVLSWTTAAVNEVRIEVPGQAPLYTSTSSDDARDGSFVYTVPSAVGEDELVSFRLVGRGEVAGSTASRTLELFVSGQPRIRSFDSPAYALLGSTFELAWSTANALSVELAADGLVIARIDDQVRVAAGSITLPTPPQATSYTLTARDGRGSQHAVQATVDPVGVPQVNGFSATPGTGVTAGDPVTLTWDVPSARELRITAEGEAVVHAVRGMGAAAGSLTVYPGTDTVYLLEADNTAGNKVSASAAVAMTAPGAFTVSPAGTVIEQSVVQVGTTAASAGAEAWGVPHSQIDYHPSSTGFIDIGGSGTELSMGTTTTGKATFAPGFDTWLFGKRLAGGVTVSVNGHLAFGSTVTSATANKTLPNATVDAYFLSPLWVYLKMVDESAVQWEVVGDAPEQVLIVQWSRMEVNLNPGSEITFQVQVHQSGVVRYEYQTVSTTSSLNPAIGVQGLANGVEGLQAQLGWPSQGSAVTFFGPRPLPVEVAVFPGERVHSGFVKLGDAYLRLPLQLPPTLPKGVVRITEVLAQPAAPLAATGEWVEIFNPGPTDIDLDGWTLHFPGDVVHTLASANGLTLVGAGEVRLFGQSLDPVENDGVPITYAYGAGITLPDSGGIVSINKVGPADSFSWSASTEGVSAIFDPGPVFYSADAVGLTPRGIACAATLVFGSQTPEQKGTPGVAGGCLQYTLSRVPGDFEDIAAVGVDVLPLVTGTTGFRANIPLPAPFTYYGVPYTQFHASTSGIISFGSATGQVMTTTYTANGTKPATTAPNNVIAVFWDSLNRRTEGKLLMHRNADHTILSWNNFRYSTDTNGDYSFQVKLFDDGVIETHYGAMISGGATYDAFATGSSATVWVENGAGTSAIVAAINTVGAVVPSVAFRFTPN